MCLRPRSNIPCLPSHPEENSFEDEFIETSLEAEDEEMMDDMEGFGDDDDSDGMVFTSQVHDGVKYVSYDNQFYADMDRVYAALLEIKLRMNPASQAHHIVRVALRFTDSVGEFISSGGHVCVFGECQQAISDMADYIEHLCRAMLSQSSADVASQHASEMMFLTLAFVHHFLPGGDAMKQNLGTVLHRLRSFVAHDPMAHPFMMRLAAHGGGEGHDWLHLFGDPNGWDEEGEVMDQPATAPASSLAPVALSLNSAFAAAENADNCTR